MITEVAVPVRLHTARHDTRYRLILYVCTERIPPSELPLDGWVKDSDVRVVHYDAGRTDVVQLAREIWGAAIIVPLHYDRLSVIAPADSTAIAQAIRQLAMDVLDPDSSIDELVVGEPGNWPDKVV